MNYLYFAIKLSLLFVLKYLFLFTSTKVQHAGRFRRTNGNAAA